MSRHLIDDSIVVDKRKEIELSVSRFEKALKVLQDL
jgi:hypothetical protein